MDQDKQKQITMYFIEEAKEHLQTIESGLLNLQSIMGNVESVNEVFRAAHSIKGGAAMLGFSSIQHRGSSLNRMGSSKYLIYRFHITHDRL